MFEGTHPYFPASRNVSKGNPRPMAIISARFATLSDVHGYQLEDNFTIQLTRSSWKFPIAA